MKKRFRNAQPIVKIICVLLSLSILASVLCGAAAIPKNENEVTPIVIVPGFASTILADGDGNPLTSPEGIAKALGIQLTKSGEYYSDDLGKVLSSEDMIDVLDENFTEFVSAVVEPLRMGKDGKPCYDVKPIVSGAENTSYKAFKESGTTEYIPYASSEFLNMESVAEKVGDENVFNFTYDWRIDYCELAAQLDTYIDDVLELTGAEKVSIYAISQGCMLTCEYMYEYSDKELVDNLVFDTPALGGTSLPADLFSQTYIDLNYKEIFALVCEILHIEINLATLADVVSLDSVTKLLNTKRFEVLAPVLTYAPAIIELVAPDRYEEVKDSLLGMGYDLDCVAFEKVDHFHDQYIKDIHGLFETIKEHGTTASIKVCSGLDDACTTAAYGDVIIDTKYACGATCVPYGEKFDDSYVQKVDTGHYNISPDRTIDLSTGYIPDRTWVVDGLGHGQVEWCSASLALVETLLYTHDLEDAYSSFEFPQFMNTYSSSRDINIKFATTNNLFLQTNDDSDYELIVTNTSKYFPIIVTNISSDIAKVDLGSFNFAFIPPQSSIAFKVTLNDDVQAPAYDSFKVSYYSIDTLVLPLEKDFGFTVLDNYDGVLGKAVATEENDLIENLLNYVLYIVNFLLKVLEAVNL